MAGDATENEPELRVLEPPVQQARFSPSITSYEPQRNGGGSDGDGATRRSMSLRNILFNQTNGRGHAVEPSGVDETTEKKRENSIAHPVQP